MPALKGFLTPHVALAGRRVELRSWQVQSLSVAAGSVFVAACAHIVVVLPFTPVPFTFQPFAVLLVGMLLGPAAGSAALVAYICEGALGLPVFTPGGLPGVARLLGPTGGYLLAYPAAAALAGLSRVALPRVQRFSGFLLGGMVAMLLVYSCGTAWLSHVLHLSFPAAFRGGVLPFAAPDAVKVFAAAGFAAMLPERRVQS